MSYALKDIRVRKQITLDELANAVGISIRSLQRYEGGNPPNVDIAIQIAEYLEVEVETVFGK